MTDNSRDEGIFLYDSLLYEIETAHFDNRLFYYYGGRKIGKSALLNQLKKKMEVNVYNGSSYAEISELLDNKAEIKSEDKKAILIDDFDMFTYDFIKSERDDRDNFEQCFDKLYETSKDYSMKGHKIVLTGCDSPQTVLAKIDKHMGKGNVAYKLWSDVLLKWEFSLLSPWMMEPNYWKNKLKNKLKQKIDFHELSDFIVRFTGGHPLLWGAATTGLQRLGVWRDDKKPKEYLSIDKIKAYLEFFVSQQASSQIRRIIDKLNPEARMELIEIAKIEDACKNIIKNISIETILLDSGLLYYDVDKCSYCIPGTIIKEEVQRYSNRLNSQGPSFYLLPDDKNPDKSGHFIVNTGIKENKISFKSTTWAILKHLFEAQGKIISLKELRTVSRLKTDTSVRSVLNRLEKKIEDEANIDSVIENVRGEGYRYKAS